MPVATKGPLGTSRRPSKASAHGDPFDIRPYLSLAGGLAGVANVIMQLSLPAVGYGVKESRVDSGSAMLHPLKRARTTFTYLAVALLGSDDERKAFARAVNGQHAQVRSDGASPVTYNAFDPELQLWVAACLYFGLADVLARVRYPLDDDSAEALYRYSARLGTTLQVRPEMWPADRSEFSRYWRESLERVEIDDAIRDYLMGLVRLENLPVPFRLLLGPVNRFWTTGFLPPEFRTQMALPWTPTQQERFDSILASVGRVERLLPAPVRALPFIALLWDLRLRRRLGRPLV